MKNSIRLALALYVAALFTPQVHELFADGLDEGACDRCEALAYLGPQLSSRCDESRPCENPDHHHHHRHHVHGQCPICQHSQAAGIEAARGAFDQTPQLAALRASWDKIGSPRRREHSPHRARAPPVLS